MNYILLGTSYKTAPVEIREKYSFSKKQLVNTLSEFFMIDIIDEIVILSTCNRSEVYVVSEYVYEVKKLLEYKLRILNDDLKYFYFLKNIDVMKHLFCVSSGLDSQVIGENQILSQVKDAYFQARETKTISKYLNILFQQAFRVGKLVRQKTEISKGNISVATIALKLLEKQYSTLKNKKILIIGTGKISQLVLNYMLDKKINVVFVANRTYQKAVELANMISGKAVMFDKLKDELKNTDIVISATSSPHLILKKEIVKEVMKHRSSPLCIVDLAIPRDVDPEIKNVKNVVLYNLDDLNIIIENNYKKRMIEAQKAQYIVETEVEKFLQWMKDLVVPVNEENLKLAAVQVG